MIATRSQRSIGFLHVVGGEQDGLSVSVEFAEDLPQRQPALGVEAGGWFVHEQHGGPVKDGPGHHEPLGHAPGKGVHRRLGPFGQMEPLQQLVGGRPALLAAACRTGGRGSRGFPST